MLLWIWKRIIIHVYICLDVKIKYFKDKDLEIGSEIKKLGENRIKS